MSDQEEQNYIKYLEMEYRYYSEFILRQRKKEYENEVPKKIIVKVIQNGKIIDGIETDDRGEGAAFLGSMCTTYHGNNMVYNVGTNGRTYIGWELKSKNIIITASLKND